jgi:YHS domain-containing protein
MNYALTRRNLCKAALATSAIVAVPAMALAKKPGVYTGIIDGVGAGGYDVVSYTQGVPKKGDAKFAVSHDGAQWYFASAENMKAFQSDPAKFAPAFGGYCAYAVANGVTAKGDPELWKIVDGKLYFNFNKQAQSRWNEDIPGNIASGNANWPKVLD